MEQRPRRRVRPRAQAVEAPRLRTGGVRAAEGEARQDGQEPRSTRTGARETEYGRQSDGGGATRITVGLPGNRHGFPKTFVARSGSDGMSVVRTLLVEISDDPKLQARVRRISSANLAVGSLLVSPSVAVAEGYPAATTGDTYSEPFQNGSTTGPTALDSAPHITASAPGPRMSMCLSMARSLSLRN